MWGQDGWILAKFFFCVFTDWDAVEVHKLAKKRTWSIKDLLYGFWGNFSCGTQQVVLNGQDSSILPSWVANHSIGFDSSARSHCKPYNKKTYDPTTAILKTMLKALCYSYMKVADWQLAVHYFIFMHTTFTILRSHKITRVSLQGGTLYIFVWGGVVGTLKPL